MATHSSVLAWRIPGTGEPVGCRLWGRTEADATERLSSSSSSSDYCIEHPFMCLLAITMRSLERCILSFSAHFLLGVLFFDIKLYELLVYFGN